MKLCVFQGTFNPIHRGHLNIAEFALNNYGFDKIIFIPAARPPHKDCDVNMENHRLELVKIAVGCNEKFEVSDIEYRRDGKSYTYLTILELYKLYKNIDGKISFIIGTDAFEKIESWYEAEKLKQIVNFIVFKRESDFNPQKLEYFKSKGYNYTVADLEFLDISSSDIREGFAFGKDMSGMLGNNELEYIEKYELYKS